MDSPNFDKTPDSQEGHDSPSENDNDTCANLYTDIGKVFLEEAKLSGDYRILQHLFGPSLDAPHGPKGLTFDNGQWVNEMFTIDLNKVWNTFETAISQGRLDYLMKDLVEESCSKTTPKDDKEHCRPARRMEHLRLEVRVLFFCVNILEEREVTIPESSSESDASDTKVPESETSFENLWILIQDFSPLYLSYLKTGDLEVLLEECRSNPNLDWRHAMWLRMFVCEVFGCSLEELYRPRWLVNLSSFISDGREQVQSAICADDPSLRSRLATVFEVSTVKEWTDKHSWRLSFYLVLSTNEPNGVKPRRTTKAEEEVNRDITSFAVSLALGQEDD